MEEHIDDLLTHVRRVQDNGVLLAKRLIKQGRHEFARALLANVAVHDASKWSGIEWDWLHLPPAEMETLKVRVAVRQHQSTNMHHPEYWGHLRNMPEIYVAEMVCDWLARAQEMGTDIREYVIKVCSERFDFAQAAEQKAWIWTFIELLLPPKFVK